MIKTEVFCDKCGEPIDCSYATAPVEIFIHENPNTLVYYSNGSSRSYHLCQKHMRDMRMWIYGDGSNE